MFEKRQHGHVDRLGQPLAVTGDVVQDRGFPWRRCRSESHRGNVWLIAILSPYDTAKVDPPVTVTPSDLLLTALDCGYPSPLTRDAS